MDESPIEALKREHGEVYVISAAGCEIAVRMPTVHEFERFQDSIASDKKKGTRALAQLVRDCLVFPSREEYDAIVARRPGLPVSFGSEVVKIAGLVDEVEAKKA